MGILTKNRISDENTNGTVGMISDSDSRFDAVHLCMHMYVLTRNYGSSHHHRMVILILTLPNFTQFRQIPLKVVQASMLWALDQ
jgi:hypothetical protein